MFELPWNVMFNSLRPRQNGRHFADDVFKYIFLKEKVWILLKFSPKFVPKVPINNIPALVQIMAWHHSGDKPLSEPMMVSLLMHICFTRPQWVKYFCNMAFAKCWQVMSKVIFITIPFLIWWVFHYIRMFLILNDLLSAEVSKWYDAK